MSTFTVVKQIFAAGLIFVGGLELAGAADLFGSDVKPDNIFRASAFLPPDLKRVVVLPLAHDESRLDLSSGCETLGPVLQSELIQTKRFELVTVGPRELATLTGGMSWTGTEDLPGTFFDSLKRVYGCDAILFCQLTTYHPYAPLAIGWRMKLVNSYTQKILWATDMVYDAGNAATAHDAQLFQKRQQGEPEVPRKFFQRMTSWIYHEPAPALEDQWTILNSPRYFGQYSLVKLLQTLPER